ncbi:MAG: hypothetical protein C5B49_09850 [Bdellovibrio sp.]|nr:MAG: hypothetical protein C5B49_09850 [Bdellovibrio sp.]
MISTDKTNGQALNRLRKVIPLLTVLLLMALLLPAQNLFALQDANDILTAADLPMKRHFSTFYNSINSISDELDGHRVKFQNLTSPYIFDFFRERRNYPSLAGQNGVGVEALRKLIQDQAEANAAKARTIPNESMVTRALFSNQKLLSNQTYRISESCVLDVYGRELITPPFGYVRYPKIDNDYSYIILAVSERQENGQNILVLTLENQLNSVEQAHIYCVGLTKQSRYREVESALGDKVAVF